MKRAVILGVTGQDGSYLAEYLLSEGWYVIGARRRSSCPALDNLKNVLGNKNFVLEEADVCDYFSLLNLFKKYEPDHVYNLAAQSHVGTSFNQPRFTWEVNAVGCMNALDAIFTVNEYARFYQASTSEMFGDNFTSMKNDFVNNNHVVKMFQDEKTPFRPRSPYAIAKLAAHNTVVMYREAYNRFASCGVLMNHESSRRGLNFVTRKITNYVAKIADYPEFSPVNDKTSPKLKLGNIEARRDWGYAPDYVRAMHLMLCADKPDDYVIATGQTRSVRELLDCAFKYIGINDWSPYVEIDAALFRPAEVPHLLGIAEKAKDKLGWFPKVTFDKMIHEMIDSDRTKL